MSVSKCSCVGEGLLLVKVPEGCERKMDKEPWKLCGPGANLVCKEGRHI